jgi:hypothetical protein
VQPVAAVRGVWRAVCFGCTRLVRPTALQLAAAVVAAEGVPASLDLVTLDERAAAAARREGFVVHDGVERPS